VAARRDEINSLSWYTPGRIQGEPGSTAPL
jgi:hypothetical protein